MVTEFIGILVIGIVISVGLISRAYYDGPTSASRLIALHLLGSVGLITYGLVLEWHGRELHSVGKDLGRIEMFGELRKAGVDVPDEFEPSVSKERLIGPAVSLQIKTLVIFWPSVIMQIYVLLVLFRYRRCSIQPKIPRHSEVE